MVTKICLACGKTDDEVYFGKERLRPNGYVYTTKYCAVCYYKPHPPVDKSKRATVHYRRGNLVRVLSCPHNEYQGPFYCNDFRDTLLDGFWTLGMVVSINGKKYAVCGNGVVMRTMKRRGYPLDVKLPSQ